MKELNLKVEDFDLEVEVYEVSSATVLDTMGASVGTNSCSVVVTQQ
ncbi:hypothetical protein [Sutcliffiella rhizosphaerae]|uniref:Uncharacterized protein n=1 Tax=Sutcliffiella rhizosphaerae TaxID=2880967 RepID=A0ABN8A7W4_9BACI|nr:hypothetical protein [Sutcliffiella rhizosphaerae]CAG9621200.1 hypothetical protein BACCIP111883_01972 [Sutcliffiella rhizosphaerae]